ncbi:hypothetical protein [Flavobacterium nitrogenifigens]|uniref:Uncharacterized protein n=1 Tax=Flavobacterium nitrogenifigens TaxID=1617283 RepID=A0A521AEC8_9FLAO|nr:hypothetical protein [Flavobacterium nitrogenifigens]KAF2331457.1 hypothetical protein DM397_12020 [Flavobacterium nitrogenifigens]SMO33050.1 hypothetical protein SAMN06265220_10151 [Flavobacterium nitrogenifigens]
MTKNTGCAGCKSQSADNKENNIKMLVSFFPILKAEYRELKKAELESEKVFKELFPDNATVDLGLLKAVYQYQQLKNDISK